MRYELKMNGRCVNGVREKIIGIKSSAYGLCLPKGSKLFSPPGDIFNFFPWETVEIFSPARIFCWKIFSPNLGGHQNLWCRSTSKLYSCLDSEQTYSDTRSEIYEVSDACMKHENVHSHVSALCFVTISLHVISIILCWLLCSRLANSYLLINSRCNSELKFRVDYATCVILLDFYSD